MTAINEVDIDVLVSSSNPDPESDISSKEEVEHKVKVPATENAVCGLLWNGDQNSVAKVEGPSNCRITHKMAVRLSRQIKILSNGGQNSSADDAKKEYCPTCTIGLLKYLYIDQEKQMKMCINLGCSYPFENGNIELRNQPVEDSEFKQKILTTFMPRPSCSYETIKQSRRSELVGSNEEIPNTKRKYKTFEEILPLAKKYLSGVVPKPEKPSNFYK